MIISTISVRSSAMIPVEKERARNLFTAFYSRGEMGTGEAKHESDVRRKMEEEEEEGAGGGARQGRKHSSRRTVMRHERKKQQRPTLGDLASLFAREVSDVLGHGRVSFLEMQRYFREHQGDPEAAVREVSSLLLFRPDSVHDDK